MVPDAHERLTVEPTAVTKGYSIWSLLVIMTLLAVWLAVPRRQTSPRFNTENEIFFACHQIALWTIAGVGFWILLGKRKLILLGVGTVIAIIWTPMILMLVEGMFVGDAWESHCAKLLRSIGVFNMYLIFLKTAYTGMGYDFPA